MYFDLSRRGRPAEERNGIENEECARERGTTEKRNETSWFHDRRIPGKEHDDSDGQAQIFHIFDITCIPLS